MNSWSDLEKKNLSPEQIAEAEREATAIAAEIDKLSRKRIAESIAHHEGKLTEAQQAGDELKAARREGAISALSWVQMLEYEPEESRRGLEERVCDRVMFECRRSGISEGKERVLVGAVRSAFQPDPPGPPNPPLPPRSMPVG